MYIVVPQEQLNEGYKMEFKHTFANSVINDLEVYVDKERKIASSGMLMYFISKQYES